MCVFENLDLQLYPGECVVITGASGSGKSTLLRLIFGNYLLQTGCIYVRHNGGLVDIASSSPREILLLRRWTLGYVSQFLRVIPRVQALQIVAEPLRRRGVPTDIARQQAAQMLERLHVPPRLWLLPPATFSGGEQQRVNLARAFVADYPVMLLDEPTAALDSENRDTAMALMEESKKRGARLLGVFHDQEVRAAVGTRSVNVEVFRGRHG
jgi:alpha-D-ribose 1-methylphosphonate 5-triphosphate synthase subunit PhnL